MECYQCERTVIHLSRRSRCVTCECSRADFNEEENDKLRERVADLESMLQLVLNIHRDTTWGGGKTFKEAESVLNRGDE